MAHPGRPTHLFHDMNAFISDRLKRVVNCVGDTMTIDHLMPFVGNASELVTPHAHCVCHNKMCTVERATIHIAGTPCVDWSPMGSNKKGDGCTAVVFMVWVFMRLVVQEPIIVQENSDRLPVTVLERALGHMYVDRLHL